MANRIERKIHRLLTVEKEAKVIFDELTIDLFQKKLTRDERVSIFNFGWNAGLYQQLLSNFVELFHEKAEAPWGHYIQLLQKLNVTPTEEVIASVSKGVRKQGLSESVSMVRVWDQKDPRFVEFRESVVEKRKQDHANKKRTMIERIEFYRSQRMFEEEKRALKILLKMFPDDADIKKEYEKFQLQWAKEVIAQNSFEKVQLKIFNRKTPSTKEVKIVSALLKDMLLKAQSDSINAYNFALAMKSFGHPDAALKILAHADEDWATEWLRIELLIDGGRFIDCLNAVHDLELRHASDPETTFAATYARAKALNGLGQNGPAIDLLQSIVNVRPNYRSAYSLMTEWAEKS